MTGQQALRPSVRFGEFELIPSLRRLERGGEMVELSSRALDILAALTARPGEVISKRELLELAWPDTVVVEAAVRQHMVSLRRALRDGEGGHRLIVTVPGRGYCFVGSLQPAPAVIEGGSPVSRDASQPLPPRPANVVGRDAVVEELLRQLELHRFVTVVGSGGIGKTTVALMAAHNWVAAHVGMAVFVDLGNLAAESSEGVAEALCVNLGLVPQGNTPTESAIAQLRTSKALIVLDTCEGVIEAAARLAESLVAAAPGVRVFATSRESLRAQGELVHRLQPLAAPAAGLDLMAREALTYPAVQLFVQRVAANHLGYELSDQEAAVVGDVCRELDGMALAIELAAGRVEAFGIQRVADLLATEFALTWPGRRTAAPRQQTLRATLNWSHELLAPIERVVFRRLSALSGAFPLEAAIAVGSHAGLAATDVIGALSSLVAKSLLNSVVKGATNRFRMLDTTRSYALTKLAESGDERTTRLLQAEYYFGRLSAADVEDDEPAATAEVVANVSAALRWAFSAQDDRSIGIRLAGAAAGLWVRHGLLAECRRWAAAVQARVDGDPSPSDVRTQLILANALMVTDGIRAERRREMETVYANALEQGQLDEKVSGLCILWADENRRCRYAAAGRLIDEADFLEAPDASHAHRLTALWLKGMTDHCAGRQARACEHLTRLLAQYTEDAGRQFLRQQGYDLEAAGATILGMSEFLRGNLVKAFSASDRAVAKARTLSSPISLGAVMRWRAMMMYYFDEDGLEIDRLKREILPAAALFYADNRPEGTALAVHGLWLARDGDCSQGAEMVRKGLKATIEDSYLTIQSFVQAEIALQLLRHGAEEQIDEFLTPLEDSDKEEGWSTPEVLRIRGEIAERRGNLGLADVHYREALVLAERQDALTWRLRAAISLADLWQSQGRTEDAAALLEPIRGQFPSGVDWPLLRRAAGRLELYRGVLAGPRGRRRGEPRA
jgi:predicted ATPase/DNA-binding winged helix-turn-helix (wHTH) protein